MDDVLHLLPHSLHLGSVENASSQSHQRQEHQGDHHPQPDKQYDLSPVLRINDRLLENTHQVRSKLINALLHPQDGDDGGVDLAEVGEGLQPGHHHVDLEPGLGAESGPRDVLDIKPESVLLLSQ